MTCPGCDSTLARVSSLEAIKQMEKNQVTCPSCESKLASDSYQDCYLISRDFASLLDGSKWMELELEKEFSNYINNSRIITGVQDGPNELDIVINHDGYIILAELKDSRFSIGHAYSFVGKCTQYRPDLSMIIATEGIDKDVKEYIANTELETIIISGLSDLSQKIESTVSKINTTKLSQLISDIPIETYFTQTIVSGLGESLQLSETSRRSQYLRRIYKEPLF